MSEWFWFPNLTISAQESELWKIIAVSNVQISAVSGNTSPCTIAYCPVKDIITLCVPSQVSLTQVSVLGEFVSEFNPFKDIITLRVPY